MKINYISVDSIGELRSYLIRQKDYCGIILGEDCPTYSSAGAMEICDSNFNIRIGLITEENIKPKIILLESMLFVGLNKEINIISADLSVKCYKALSTFFDFIVLKNGEVVSVFETDIICLSKFGDIKWNYYASDIITDYVVKDSSLILSFLDSDNITILLETGELQKV